MKLPLGRAKRAVMSVLARYLWKYDSGALLAQLRRLGVQEGDALMVHASWNPHSGFQGSPMAMIEALKTAVGPEGLLAMPSMTYQGSSKNFLARREPLDLRRSPSRMGLLSEVFRRNKLVKRSLSPTHPVLAWGKQADWFLADHERQLVPFGPDSPFGKLLQLGGKVLCIDASFGAITFTHFVEDRVRADLGFPLYDPDPMTGVVIDTQGRHHEVAAMVIGDTARAMRREERLVSQLKGEGLLKRARIGNTALLVVECKAMVACVDRMRKRGSTFFDSPVPPT